MRQITFVLIVQAITLTASNYGFQAVMGGLWDVALERSAFQAAALFCAWFAVRGATRIPRE
jgi:hypothetical protein